MRKPAGRKPKAKQDGSPKAPATHALQQQQDGATGSVDTGLQQQDGSGDHDEAAAGQESERLGGSGDALQAAEYAGSHLSDARQTGPTVRLPSKTSCREICQCRCSALVAKLPSWRFQHCC